MLPGTSVSSAFYKSLANRAINKLSKHSYLDQCNYEAIGQYLRGGVLLAMITSLAFPILRVLSVCLYPRQYLPLFITRAKRELMPSEDFFYNIPIRPFSTHINIISSRRSYFATELHKNADMSSYTYRFLVSRRCHCAGMVVELRLN